MLRRATPADADALSELARECFRQTFAHLYAAEDLATFLDEAYAPSVLRSELKEPDRATWLLFAEEHDESGTAAARPIGYVSARPARLPHPEVAAGDGEIQRLYVLREYQGGGRGTLLLETALAWLERHGPRTLWIGVWSENLGHSGSTNVTGSRSWASTPSWSDHMPTANSSPAGSAGARSHVDAGTRGGTHRCKRLANAA